MAIAAPFRFAMASGPFDLPSYDTTAGGFALPDLGSPSLAARAGNDLLHLRGAEAAPRFLRMDERAARQLVKSVVGGSAGERRVRMVIELEATAFDKANLLVDVHRTRLALYDPLLATVLYIFPETIGSVRTTLTQLAHPPGIMRTFNVPNFEGMPLLPAHADWKGDLFLLLGLGAINDQS